MKFRGVYDFRNYRTRKVLRRSEKELFNRTCFSVWDQAGYVEGSISDTVTKYEKFDEYSEDFLVFFKDNPVGTIRVIYPSDKGLPVLNDFDITDDSWERPAAEFTLLTVIEDFRGKSHLPSFFLFRVAYQSSKRKGMKGILMAADYRLYGLMKKLFAIKQIGPSKFYEGSETFPAYINIREGEEQIQQTNASLHEFFVLESAFKGE
ncbi:MAG: hypothetical protein GF370_03075 [Candidatus Nealsonbacteria bacterium]|nr:hypothetical protein [Candidatus Nealsonbacteria bacterium]